MNTKLRYLAVLVAASLTLVFCLPSFGQVNKGSISGLVTDPQGAVVTGAQVKAKNVETGVVSTTATDSSGNFRLNLLPVGRYTVEISTKGFKTASVTGVEVNGGLDTAVGAVKMTLGEQSTTVEVSGEAPLIETTQSQISSTFSGTALNTFAGIQENEGLDRLALFVPGVVATRSDNFSNTNGGGFSSNGLRGRNNDQEIDGQNNNDNSVGGPGLFVSDTNFVQQYVIITNNFGPEYGRNAGSVINVITKSGTNAWHGSIYGTEFSNYLNAMSNTQKHSNKIGTNSQRPGTVTCTLFNPICNPLGGPLRSNEEFSGGTIGGPIVKNKWFLFGGFDTDIFSGSANFFTNTTTPTPAGLATLGGCFPTGVQAQQIALLSKFGGWGFGFGSPTVQGAVQNTIVTVGTVSCPNVQQSGISRIVSTPVRAYNFPVRVDGQIGSDNVMARYLYNKQTFFNNSDNGAAGYVFDEPALSQMILLGDTHNFSSHMVNEARVGFGRLGVNFGGSALNPFETTPQQVLNALANVSIGASLGFGPATNLPQSRMVNTWQAQDNWNWVRGKHAFKGGVNWSYQRSPNVFLPNVNGQYSYGSLSNFINGTLTSVTIAQGNPNLDFREYDTFLYGGDDWKIRQNLTLNLGLTWTYYGNPAQLFTDITTKRESNPATALWLQSLPLSIRTVPHNDAPKNSFGPAVGFAYVPEWGGMFTGHGKTTIRGGFRMLYDPPFYNIFLNTSTSVPMGFLSTLTPAQLPVGYTIPSVPTGPNVRASLSSFIVTNTIDPRTQSETIIGDGKNGLGPDKVYTWSFGFEREVAKNAALEIRYVGNMGRNLFQTVDANPYAGLNLPPVNGVPQHGLLQDFPNLIPNASSITPCATTVQSLAPGQTATDLGRVNCGLGVVRARTNGAFSDYHAVQSEFRANNLFKQLTIRAGYTFSKNLDNVSEIFATGTAGNTLFAAQNPFQTGDAERSLSGLNIPHQFTVTFTENVPFFREQHGLVGHVLGGWNFSGAYIWASGQPFSPRQGGVFGNVNSRIAATGNYFDTSYALAFVGDPARPFFGSKSAPLDSVGIACGDLVSLLGATATNCAGNGGLTQLISFNALNAPNPTNPRGCLRGGGACPIVPVSANQVRYIINMHTAQSIFGSPFGTVPRNTEIDAPSNRLDASIWKNIKISERSNFEMRLSALNALNHFNFSSIDPNMEDAGLSTIGSNFGLGFNNPAQTSANGRTVAVSGRLTW